MKTPPNKQRKHIVVLDTSAFLAGFDPCSLNQEQATVPKVEEEIKKNSIIKLRFETALENGKLKIKAPSPEFLNKIQAAANKFGDSFTLSETDTQLLALALELKLTGYSPQLISDDYSIQNVATQLSIEFASVTTFGIKRLLEWKVYCPACHKEYPANTNIKECHICGTPLKRKPNRTVKIIKAR